MELSVTDVPTSTNLMRTGDGSKVRRQENDLPVDILSIIAEKLDIIGLLHFKAVCKLWNSLPSNATAAIECSPGREPWFLVYGGSSSCTMLTPSGKKYETKYPELVGTTCIASRDGWLLLLNERSVSFFCPFSRVKLNLPDLPNWEFPNVVATFSSPPTSSDCIVAILLQKEEEEEDIQLYLIRRGGKDWSKHTLINDLQSIKGAACYDNVLYFPDSESGLIEFYLEDATYDTFLIVPHDPASDVNQKLPFHRVKTYLDRKNMKEKLGLEGDVCIKTCGTSTKMEDSNRVVFYESLGDDVDRAESKLIKGVWIYPRFFQVGAHFNW